MFAMIYLIGYQLPKYNLQALKNYCGWSVVGSFRTRIEFTPYKPSDPKA